MVHLETDLCLIPVCNNSINTSNKKKEKRVFLKEQQIDFSSFL